ncbi:MAG: hypothetical protein ACO3K2_02830 [Nitrosopumilaceae archaeon]
MSNDKSSSFDDSMDLFVSESKRVQSKIDSTLKNSNEFSISQIVEIYHQVINVTSMAKILKENTNLEESFLSTIQETEKFIKEKFNTTLHSQISSHLQKSIENLKNDLKNISKNRDNKTKTEIENQAKMFERLRQFMSTQEFVEQYDKISTE